MARAEDACEVAEALASIPGVAAAAASKDGLPLCSPGTSEEVVEGLAAWAAESLRGSSIAVKSEGDAFWIAVRYGDFELSVVAKAEAALAVSLPLIRLAANKRVYCPRCRAHLTLAVVKCPHCGRPMPFVSDRCPSCGAAVPVKRCPRCGARLESNGRPARGGLLSRILGG